MKHFSLFLTTLIIIVSCSGNETQVSVDFKAKKALLPNGELFKVFDRKDMSDKEREAMQFLYAYMPVADVMNKEGDYFLAQVRSALQTRSIVGWGASIPEEVFRHFVLPVRVNNEDLDDARLVFADELRDRVKGMTMREAVLEVNYWCHAHVIYTPSDQRTIAPLAAVKTAQGRCGEESTFVVTALRAVGIPARQIYTPRWAHTDSNHAWVEAWIDGKWYFFGACEPEPVLNKGWFNGPAYRAMLLHTRVFGKYNGPEEVMMRTANYTEINVLPDYAPVARGTVTVIDAQGKPVKDANVEFMIYNSVSFFSVLSEKTDAAGQCSLTAGKGDMFIWVTKGDKVACGKLSFGKDDGITLVLDKKASELKGFDLDIIPPPPGSVPSEEAPSEAALAEHSRRMAEDDSIRNAYTSTFFTAEQAQEEAEKLALGDTRAASFMVSSRGNRHEIVTFLKTTPPEKRRDAVALLGAVSVKDLQDTPADVFTAHLEESANTDSVRFVNYILNPRVGSELITPYKRVLRELFTAEFIAEARLNPELLVKWCKNNLKIIDELNPQRIMSSPAGIAKARVCDVGSRDIFFIALCRSLGIPARTDPVARRPQYYNSQWHNANFDGEMERSFPTGYVKFVYENTDGAARRNYSVSFIDADGKLSPRNYRAGRGGGRGFGGNDEGARGGDEPLEAETGSYMLLSGTRLDDGSVLAHIDFYTVEEGKTTEAKVTVRNRSTVVKVIGKIDTEATFQSVNGSNTISSIVKESEYFVLGILGARQEPTNHALNDIARESKSFNDAKTPLILLFPNSDNYNLFDVKEFRNLPQNIIFGVDATNLAEGIATQFKLPDPSSLPIFIIADSKGQIVYVSQGYKINIGEEMLKVINSKYL